MCLRSNPPWAGSCAACGAELSSGDYRPPEWLLTPRGSEPPIFALRRRRRRRQWWGLAILALICCTIAYGWYARNIINEPTPGPGTAETGMASDWQPDDDEPIPTAEDPTEGDQEDGPGDEAPGTESEEPGAESEPGEDEEPDEPGEEDDGETDARPSSTTTHRPSRTTAGGPRPPRTAPAQPSGPSGPPVAPPAAGVETKVWEKDGAEMVRVAGGSLEMGASSGEAAEKPVHAVSIPTFWIDRTEVTNEQYKKFIDATGRPVPYVAEPWAAPYNWDRAARTYPDGQGDMPVVLVSWDDAAAYARWAGKRLPTEAEWEYAARGAQGKKFPWGDSWNAALCNSLGSDPFDATPAPVGSFPKGASWCGAMDMAGNVWEWVADWYSADYYSASPSKDPAGPATGRYRAIRGGSWGSPSDLCRSYARGFRPPYARSDAAGFRCAADPSS